jgi:hypothetical protein
MVGTMTTTFAALRTRLRAILRDLDDKGPMNILLSTEGDEARTDDCGMRGACWEVFAATKKAPLSGA